MTYEDYNRIYSCNSIEEAAITCDLIGSSYDLKEIERFIGLEKWQRTLYLYDLDCKRRGVKNALT